LKNQKALLHKAFREGKNFSAPSGVLFHKLVGEADDLGGDFFALFE
jgi:hypothetical protein